MSSLMGAGKGERRLRLELNNYDYDRLPRSRSCHAGHLRAQISIGLRSSSTSTLIGDGDSRRLLHGFLGQILLILWPRPRFLINFTNLHQASCDRCCRVVVLTQAEVQKLVQRAA